MGRVVTGGGSNTKSASAGIPVGSSVSDRSTTLCFPTWEKSVPIVCTGVEQQTKNKYVGKSKIDLQDIELRLLGEIANLKTDSRRARQKL